MHMCMCMHVKRKGNGRNVCELDPRLLYTTNIGHILPSCTVSSNTRQSPPTPPSSRNRCQPLVYTLCTPSTTVSQPQCPCSRVVTGVLPPHESRRRYPGRSRFSVLGVLCANSFDQTRRFGQLGGWAAARSSCLAAILGELEHGMLSSSCSGSTRWVPSVM